MHGKQYRNRRFAHWMTAATVCGAFLALTTAAFAEPTHIGTVMGVPVTDLENFRRANAITGRDAYGQQVPANDVTILHISSVAGAPINSAIATVSINQKGSGLKAWRVYFPPVGNGEIAPLYQYINVYEFFSNPRVVVGNGTAAVQMDVRQEYPGDSLLEQTRFMLVPANAIHRLQSENPKARLEVAHTQRMVIGLRSMVVQLLAIDSDHARELKISEDVAGMIQALNSNITLTPIRDQGVITGRLASVN